LAPIAEPKPIRETRRLEAPMPANEVDADLDVRSRSKTMPTHAEAISRRDLLAAGAAAATSIASAQAVLAGEAKTTRPPKPDKALIGITLDLEMARNFPTWDQTHWDYEKGNLDDDAKRYSVDAARRVKESGGRIHFFALGQTLEQANVDWLKGIVKDGHPVGNHTYDHVYVLARKIKDVQFRFSRAPWLVHGKTPAQVIRENIQLCTMAMKARLGIKPAGFRTPGGFPTGLGGRPDVQKMLMGLGFDWVSAKWYCHTLPQPGKKPTKQVYDAMVNSLEKTQPFVYPTGLIDVPMSPVSDVVAFRVGRWRLEYFLEATRLSVEWAIAHRAAFDFLAHPSVLGVVDPKLRAIDLICKRVQEAGDRAAIVDLTTMARRAKAHA